MENEIIVGLDIGTTKIAAIVGRKNQNNKIEILGHGTVPSYGVRRGMVANIKQTEESIQAAVKKAAESADVEINTVRVGIAGQHIRSHQHCGSLIRKKNCEEITEDELNDFVQSMFNLAMDPGEVILAVMPQEYTVDGETGILNPIGMMCSRLDGNFHIISGNGAAVQNIAKCVSRAGLELEDLVLEPLSSAQAVVYDDEREAGVVLVDIGGGTTDVAIYHNNVLRHTAVIPFGGELITDDICAGCAILHRDAEQLKIKHGSALAQAAFNDIVITIPGLRGRPPKEITKYTLASIIQARMEEIISAVNNEIVASGYEHKLAAGIVFTGGGAQIADMEQFSAYFSRMETRIGAPGEHLSGDTVNALKKPLFATGIGLVMLGLIEGVSYISGYADDNVSDYKGNIQNIPEIEQEDVHVISDKKEVEKNKSKVKKEAEQKAKAKGKWNDIEKKSDRLWVNTTKNLFNKFESFWSGDK